MTIAEAAELMVSLYLKGLVRGVTLGETLVVDCWTGTRFTSDDTDKLVADVQREIGMYTRGED